MIIQTTGQDNITSLSFTVQKKDLKNTLNACNEIKDEIGARDITSKENISIVSAIGVGMLSSYGVAGRMFRILSEHGINIEMISTSEIGISCVIDDKYAELAAKIIHKEFVEEIL
jgi:aspartate kinase